LSYSLVRLNQAHRARPVLVDETGGLVLPNVGSDPSADTRQFYDRAELIAEPPGLVLTQEAAGGQNDPLALVERLALFLGGDDYVSSGDNHRPRGIFGVEGLGKSHAKANSVSNRTGHALKLQACRFT
jgi:hypothetical protein